MSKTNNLQSKERRLLADLTRLTTSGIRTTAQKTEFERIEKELAETRDDLRSLEMVEAHFAKNGNATSPAPVAAPAVPAFSIVRSTDQAEAITRREHREAFAATFLKTLRRGGIVSDLIERRDVTTANSGGLVPQSFVEYGWWANALREVSPIATMVSNKNFVAGFRPTKSPIVDATSVNALYVPESGSVSTGNQTVAGSLTSGTFTDSEELIQATSLATATYAGNTSILLRIVNVTGTPDNSHEWVGQTSGAIFTASAVPVVLSAVQTPTVSSKIAGADNLVSVVTASWQEFEDADSLENWLRSVAAVVLGRAQELAILQGVDANGFILPHATALAPTATVGYTQGSLSAGIGYPNLVTLKGSLNRGYRYGMASGFIVNQATESYMASVEDSTGRPYFLRDPQTHRLLVDGSQVYVSDNSALPTYTTASSIVALFADFSRAIQTATSDVRFQILEPNPETLTSNVIMSQRFGSALLLPGAVAGFLTAAS